MRPVTDKTLRLFRKWCVCGLFLFISSAVAYSNVFNVTNTTDGNAANQLRGAIAAAIAAGPGPHTIIVSAGFYDLTMGQIIIGNSAITLTITGANAGSTIINMSVTNQDRIFMINPPGTVPNVNVTFQNLTFSGGHLRSDNFGGGAILAGGPANNLTITNCIFNNNTIDLTAGTNGGAIAYSGGGVLFIDGCTFSNNVNPKGNGGAISYFLPNSVSGQLSVTNSTFTNNSVTATNSDGGAIQVAVQGTLGTTTSIVTIERNTFTNNLANASGGEGGAIIINNGFAIGNVANVDFNRFAGNSATDASTSGLAMVSAAGSVNAQNNWWGCNTGPLVAGTCNRAAIVGTGGAGTLQIPTWIQLVTSSAAGSICSGNTGNSVGITASFKTSAGATIAPSLLTVLIGLPITFSSSLGTISGAQSTIQPNATATATFTSNGSTGTATVNSVVDNVPGNDATARASITVNAPPSISIQPSPLSVCPGNEATFSVTASGSSLTYAWFKNTSQLTDGTTASGSIIAGSTASTLAIRNPSAADNSTAYNVLVTGSNGCASRSNNTQLTVAPLVIPGSNSGGLRDINVNDFAVNDGSCNRIALVQPTGTAPITGFVNASVTIDAGQPTYNGMPYVKRHYDIVPSVNPNNATAIVTLYFLQSEFDSYNAATPGTATDLPTNPADVTGRSNLRVTQYHGTGTAPGNYTGWAGMGPKVVLINPGGGNVVWNSTSNWWEVTFPVTGFSGFFITGLINNPLPVTLQSFTAVKEQNSVLVKWEAAREVDFSHYDVETSTDGRNYHSIGTVTATHSTSYSFVHNNPANGVNYYRLKMLDLNGDFSYSKVVSVLFSVDAFAVQVLSNPFRQVLNVRIDADKNAQFKLQLTDQAGKILAEKSISISKGTNMVNLPASQVSNGIYLLRINGGGYATTIRVLKSQ